MPVLFLMAFLSLSALWQAGQNKNQPSTYSKKALQDAPRKTDKSIVEQQTTKAQTEATPIREKEIPRLEPKPWLTHAEWVMAILTGIYVVFTGVYVLISLLTLRTIKRQGKHAEDEAIANAAQFQRQLAVMEAQVTEMQAGRIQAGEKTDKLIEQAEYQAEALLSAAEIAVTHASATTSVAEATRLNAQVGQATASAALLNAQAVINAERAWIIPKMKKITDNLSVLILTNFGKTPGEIVGIDRRDLFPNRLDDLPADPNYGPETRFQQMRILCAGEQWDFESTSLDVVPDMTPILTSVQRFVVAYRVRYLDLLKHPHESRVCYFWSPPLREFIPAGHPEWTKYT